MAAGSYDVCMTVAQAPALSTTSSPWRRARPWLFVLLATSGLACKGIFAKLAYAEGVRVSSLLVWRFALVVPLLWLTLRLLRATSKMGADVVEPDRNDIWRVIGVGFFFATGAALDFVAVERMGASLSRLLLFTYPVFLVVGDALRRRRWPRMQVLLALSLTLGCLALLLLGEGQSFVGVTPFNVGLSLLSALTYAFHLGMGAGVSQRRGGPRFAAEANTATLLFALPGVLVVVGAEAFVVPAAGWPWVLCVVVVSTLLPFILLYQGLSELGAMRTGFVAMLGPVVTVVLAWQVLGETLQLQQWAAALGVVLSVGWLKKAS